MKNKLSIFDPKAYLASKRGALQDTAASQAAEREYPSRADGGISGKYETNGSNHADSFTDLEKARMVADAVIQQGIDITAQYNDWVRIGYALAHSLGEGGRGIYHDVSSLYPEYRREQCDRQYDSCLRGSSQAGGGVQLGTFFEIARRTAGVNVADVMREERKKRKSSAQNDGSVTLPPCPKTVSNNLKNNYNTENKDFMKKEENLKQSMQAGKVGIAANSAAKTKDNGVFSDRLNSADLPEPVRNIYELYDDDVTCDKMILATLNVISGLLGTCNGTHDSRSGIYGLYDDKRVYTPLYNIIYANAGSGKGEVNVCRQLYRPMQEKMRKQYAAEKAAYDQAMAKWEQSKKSKKAGTETYSNHPQEPKFHTLIAAGNSTSAAVYRTLDDNGGSALMFETEADSITQIQKTDWGNYSDLMRKAYHHEPLSMDRAQDNVHIYIEEPCLSVMLTCTPGQMKNFLGDFENGMASRFFIYGLPNEAPQFHDVFKRRSSRPIEDEFLDMGKSLMPLLDALNRRKGNPIEFVMTPDMEKDLNETFGEALQEKNIMLGNEFAGFIYRLGLGCFRYAMVLTALRLLESAENGKIEIPDDKKALVCAPRDYQTAKVITMALLSHAAVVYAYMAEEMNNPFAGRGISLTEEEIYLYRDLPEEEFESAEYFRIVESKGHGRRKGYRMIDRLIRNGLVRKTKYKHYIKTCLLAGNADSASENNLNTNPNPSI